MEPRDITPGGTATLSVELAPLRFGERSIPITIQTDSSETPVVGVRLHVIGSQRPPFLLAVAGDLVFSNCSVGDFRTVTATTIEPDEHGPPPRITCDLPFLSLTPEGTVDSHQNPGGFFVRTFAYRVTLAALPLDHSFLGELLVMDPWLADHSEKLLVRGERRAPLHLIPRVITVNPAELQTRPFERTVAVVCQDSGMAARVEATPLEAGDSWIVEWINVDSTGRVVTFRIRQSPLNQPRVDTTEIRFRDPESGSTQSLPVIFQGEDQR